MDSKKDELTSEEVKSIGLTSEQQLKFNSVIGERLDKQKASLSKEFDKKLSELDTELKKMSTQVIFYQEQAADKSKTAEEAASWMAKAKELQDKLVNSEEKAKLTEQLKNEELQKKVESLELEKRKRQDLLATSTLLKVAGEHRIMFADDLVKNMLYEGKVKVSDDDSVLINDLSKPKGDGVFETIEPNDYFKSFAENNKDRVGDSTKKIPDFGGKSKNGDNYQNEDYMGKMLRGLEEHGIPKAKESFEK